MVYFRRAFYSALGTSILQMPHTEIQICGNVQVGVKWLSCSYVCPKPAVLGTEAVFLLKLNCYSRLAACLIFYH